MQLAAAGWLAANGVAIVLLAIALVAWARARPERRRLVLAAAASLALAATALALFLPTARVPIAWVTVLMEGPTVRNVEQLYGQGAHFGSGFSLLAHHLTGHDVSTLLAVVHLNLCLAALNAVLFFFLARAVLASWWASLAFALVSAGNLDTLQATFSETPAVLWTTHFWLGCVAARIVADDADATPPVRRLALLALALIASLAALLRSELLVIGAPAVAVGTARLAGWEPAIRRAARRAAAGLRALVSGRLSILILVTVALAALELVQWPGNELGWMIAGLRPLNLSFLTLPASLAVFLPFGFVILFVLGMVHALRRWLAFLLLPVSTIVLFKVYASASHGVFFERLRYLTFLTPVALFIALFGFRELEDWARRWSWPSWWRRAAILLLVVSCTVWQPAGPKEIFRRRQGLPGLATPGFLLSWNQQTEVRYLLDLVARHPQCVLLTRSARTTWVADQRTGYRWLAFGGPVRTLREIPDDGASVERVAGEIAPGSPCVLYYRGLDCNRLSSDACAADLAGRQPLEERVLENLPYNDITEYGAHRAELRLGVYPIIGDPSAR